MPLLTLLAENCPEMSHLLAELVFIGDGLEDLGLERGAEAVAQAAEGGFEGVRSHVELRGPLGIHRGIRRGDESALELVEKSTFALVGVIGGDLRLGMTHGFERPLTVEVGIRIDLGWIGRLLACFRPRDIELDEGELPSTLLGRVPRLMIGEVEFEVVDEKGAKTSPLMPCLPQVTTLHESGKVGLGDVLRIVR